MSAATASDGGPFAETGQAPAMSLIVGVVPGSVRGVEPGESGRVSGCPSEEHLVVVTADRLKEGKVGWFYAQFRRWLHGSQTGDLGDPDLLITVHDRFLGLEGVGRQQIDGSVPPRPLVERGPEIEKK